MILLRLISWPYFRKHILRTLLTTAGIVLGVAVFVGMHTANQSVLFAFNHTVDRIAGKTELQVTAGETGFDEEVLETVQSVAVGPRRRAGDRSGRRFAHRRRRQPADPRRRHDRRSQPARLRSRVGRRGGHRRSAGVPGAARFAHPHEGVRRQESLRGEQPASRSARCSATGRSRCAAS